MICNSHHKKKRAAGKNQLIDSSFDKSIYFFSPSGKNLRLETTLNFSYAMSKNLPLLLPTMDFLELFVTEEYLGQGD